MIVEDIRSSVLASEGIPQVNWMILTGGEKTGGHVQGGREGEGRGGRMRGIVGESRTMERCRRRRCDS